MEPDMRGGSAMKLMHVGLLVTDLEAASGFYGDILGLQRASRPDLGFEGMFFGLDDGGQIHLMKLTNPYDGCELPAHGGRDRHVALGVDDLEAIKERLSEARLSFTMSRSGRAALFCRDPDGNAIELIQL